MSLIQTQLVALVDMRINAFIQNLSAGDTKLKAKMLKIWRDREVKRCGHRLISGKNIGQNCHKVATSSSPSGYCLAHIKYETIEEASSSIGVSENTSSNGEIIQGVDRAKIILIKTLQGHLIDPNTMLVFDCRLRPDGVRSGGFSGLASCVGVSKSFSGKASSVGVSKLFAIGKDVKGCVMPLTVADLEFCAMQKIRTIISSNE